MARLRARAGPPLGMRWSAMSPLAAAASRIVRVSASVEPSSTTTTSWSVNVCPATLASARSRSRPALKTGMTTETRGAASVTRRIGSESSMLRLIPEPPGGGNLRRGGQAWRKPRGAIDRVDDLHVADAVRGVGGNGHAVAYGRDEGAELMRIGRIPRHPLRTLPRRRLDPHPMIELRQDGVEDAERATLALDPRGDLHERGGEQRARDPPGGAVGKAELGPHPAIDVGAEELRLGRHDRRLGPCEEAQDADRVAAGVHRGT